MQLTIFYCWLQVRSVTAAEITFSASSPDVVDVVAGDDRGDPVILRLGVDADAVHAELPAVSDDCSTAGR